jgi:hypothetical protein
MFDGFKTRQRLKDVEEALETVQRHIKRLEIEWADTLDKLKSIVGRIAKDRERAEKARIESPSPELPQEANGETTPGLTARQATIQQQILARRRHMQ